MTLPALSELILPEGIQLIGLMGRAGTGKTTVLEYLGEAYKNVWGENFADPLKRAASQAFGIPLSHFHDRELKEEPNEFWGVSPRQIAQFFGTELFRTTIQDLIPASQSDFWIRRLHGLLTQTQFISETEGAYCEGDTIVIGDVRFENEADYIFQNNGIIIHLTRPQATDTVGIPNHASEQPIFIDPKYRRNYYVVNNAGTFDSLEETIDRIIAHSCISLTPSTSSTETEI